eukprot:6213293-Pleurochrysis_carterae.AAC.1
MIPTIKAERARAHWARLQGSSGSGTLRQGRPCSLRGQRSASAPQVHTPYECNLEKVHVSAKPRRKATASGIEAHEMVKG